MSAAFFQQAIRQALKLPPHIVVAKAVRLAARRARAWSLRRNDILHGSHSALAGATSWRPRIKIGAEDIPASLHGVLRAFGDRYRWHQFDLLGSGWVEVRYGMKCVGFEGRVFPAGNDAKADTNGEWLTPFVNASNRAEARQIWSLIDDPTYRPIDWQIDFKSGYRWLGSSHISDLAIPVDIGADVKVSWELGRLQHLPQLSLCAILARANRDGFGDPDDYAREVKNQLLDFLALNPPRFGANWLCPMDIGIRMANILLAVDLLAGAGFQIEPQLVGIVLRAARDHAWHIVDHLEWSESGRSNHYLADIVGVLWGAGYLPPSKEADAWFSFAARELLLEGDNQFLADGGNYEGSTNYHRLSGELVLYGLARLAGLDDAELERLDRADMRGLSVRSPVADGPLKRYAQPDGSESIISPRLAEKLKRAGGLTRAATRPDHNVIQIGDTDSGRLFKLHPEIRAADRQEQSEDNGLDHRHFVAAVDALFDDQEPAKQAVSMDAVVIRGLAKRRYPVTAGRTCPDFGDVAEAVECIAALPPQCQSMRRIELSRPTNPNSWQRHAFPDFGLYVFKTDEMFLAFRCAPKFSENAPSGHTHDDNLGIEYIIDSQKRQDPGTAVYTASRQIRNLYRSAAAHDVPRAIGWDVAPPASQLFDLRHSGFGTCVAWNEKGVAGMIETPRGALYRAVRLLERHIEIWDGVEPPNVLRPVPQPLNYSSGYGHF